MYLERGDTGRRDHIENLITHDVTIESREREELTTIYILTFHARKMAIDSEFWYHRSNMYKNACYVQKCGHDATVEYSIEWMQHV